MRALSALLLVALFAFASCDHHEDEAVLTLTDANFDEVVNSKEFLVVEFYAPWCGHCKKLAPEFEKAAQVLKTHTPPLFLAKVDATVETATAGRFDISGYPTLKIFRNGVPSEYKGPREANGIVSYVTKQAGDASKVLAAEEAVNAFVAQAQKEDIVLVAFLDTDSADLKVFRSVANNLRDDFLFAEVTNPSVATKFNHKHKIVAYTKHDPKETVLTGSVTATSLTNFINANAIGLVGQLTSANRKRYEASGKPLLVTHFDVDTEKNVKRTNYYVRRLEQAAKDFQGKLVFAIAENDLLDATLQDKDAKEVVTVNDHVNSVFYKNPHPVFNVDNVRKFAQEFLDGKLKPFLKSEPVPEPNDGPVTVVVGETFNSLVLDNDKDVLVEFYAPWCGHCKSLAPIYDELGESLKGVSTLRIAKIDATANDFPKGKFAVSGFPTIFLKTGSGEIKKYEGARDVDGFTKFLASEVTHKFEAPKKEKKDKKDKKDKKKDKHKEKEEL